MRIFIITKDRKYGMSNGTQRVETQKGTIINEAGLLEREDKTNLARFYSLSY